MGDYTNFKGFCHYSREVRRARKRFDRQRQFFRNEIHLLLRPVLEDESAVKSMLDNPSHKTWESQQLEDALKEHLGQNYGTCLDVIEEIGSSNQELVEFMECFNELDSERQKASPYLSNSRVPDQWWLTDIDASIENLRSSNEDLRRIRQQAIELQTPTTQLRDMQKHVSQEYSEYRMIRRASKALHAALATAWSGPDASCFGNKARHDVKLFVDAKVSNGVQMDMTVLCNSHISHLAQRTMMRLRVNSQVIDWVDPSPCSDNGRQKRRKVHFSDDTTTLSDSGSREHDSTLSPQSSSTNLSQLKNKDLCSALTRDLLRAMDQCSSICLGFIDNCSEETFRHSLYHVPERRGYEPQHLVSMHQIMERTASRELAVNCGPAQSTPDLSICFQTLHFGANFVGTSSIDGLKSMSPPTLVSEAIEDAKLQYGIRNLTLWSLGTILLQVGRWAAVDSPDDVLRIRKLSLQAPALGPRYQELTKICLECDFGYGADLSKPRLQQAVYENVVCELSAMINSLDINA
ncbi:hypothetical protein CHU98_g9403 [Xylaria longipes]|nr:hypothetical protein CHU98_g9403 [Xylaria longipes]